MSARSRRFPMNILSSKTGTSRQNRQRSSVVFCVSGRVEVILNVSSFPVSQPLLNYDRRTFFSDLAAGVTVGIVALPLAIGFGIASGVTPAQGLWTAIIAGAIIAALGGSKVQIGGPTGAFVPILAGIVAIHGYAGLAVATVMAGFFLVAMGALK